MDEFQGQILFWSTAVRLIFILFLTPPEDYKIMKLCFQVSA